MIMGSEKKKKLIATMMEMIKKRSVNEIGLLHFINPIILQSIILSIPKLLIPFLINNR